MGTHLSRVVKIKKRDFTRINTTFVLACATGNLKKIKKYVEKYYHCSDYNDSDSGGLHTEQRLNINDVYMENLLLDPDWNVEKVKYTPLSAACRWRQLEVVKFLVKDCGVRADKDKSNVQLAINAVSSGEYEIVTYLVHYGKLPISQFVLSTLLVVGGLGFLYGIRSNDATTADPRAVEFITDPNSAELRLFKFLMVRRYINGERSLEDVVSVVKTHPLVEAYNQHPALCISRWMNEERPSYAEFDFNTFLLLRDGYMIVSSHNRNNKQQKAHIERHDKVISYFNILSQLNEDCVRTVIQTRHKLAVYRD